MSSPSDYAYGPCAICGEDTEGSTYWSGVGPMPTLFTSGANEPFCSAACSAKFPKQIEPQIESQGDRE